MQQSTSLKSAALIAVTAAAVSLVIQACGGSAVAQTAGDADAIEGVWESAVSIKDCTSGAVVRSFKGEGVFHRGGTLTADNSLPPATRSTSFGAWKRDAGVAYTAKFRFLRFNPDGTVAGTQRIARAIVLAADGNSFTGTITGQVLDNAEVVLQPVCGSETAVRIY